MIVLKEYKSIEEMQNYLDTYYLDSLITTDEYNELTSMLQSNTESE